MDIICVGRQGQDPSFAVHESKKVGEKRRRLEGLPGAEDDKFRTRTSERDIHPTPVFHEIANLNFENQLLGQISDNSMEVPGQRHSIEP